jgi:hypothetical protein
MQASHVQGDGSVRLSDTTGGVRGDGETGVARTGGLGVGVVALGNSAGCDTDLTWLTGRLS